MDRVGSFEELLSQNVWSRYGFLDNPFNTKALSVSPQDPLPVSEAIVGRGINSLEFRTLTNILKTPGGGRVVIEGEVGVGKTTFVNYHRFLWEYVAKEKMLTTLHEISVLPSWTVKDFLLNVVSALVIKLYHINPAYIEKSALLQEALVLSKVYLNTSFQLQGSFLGLGGGFGKTQEITVPSPSEATLFYYLENIVQQVISFGYVAILLHFDDMELTSQRNPKALRELFEEIRNVLQIPKIYFIFIGHSGFFYEIISPLQRVRSIFYGRPIHLPPLTIEQTLLAINRRYELLSSQNFTKPVEDAFIERLYTIYEGKIRFIMDAMSLIVPELPEIRTFTFFEAKEILQSLVWENLRNFLTIKELEFLQRAAGHKMFTNQDMQRIVGISAQHASIYIAKLQELNLVYLFKQQGRNKYYKVREDVRVINEFGKNGQDQTSFSCIEKSSVSPKVRQRYRKLEELFQKHQTLSVKQYQRVASLSPSQARRDLAAFVKMNKIKKIFRGPHTYYVLLEN